MKKLFLVSSFEEVFSELRSLDEALVGKTVTFIPTASKVEEVTFYVDSGKLALENLGLIIDELDVSLASTKEIEQKLRKNEYIYVTGGNTFFLLQELRKSGADRILTEEIQNGKVYIGESAGAIVLSQSIEYMKMMDNPEEAPDLVSLDGLAAVDFYVVPHYKNPPFDVVTEQVEMEFGEKINLCLINNHQGIIVEGSDRRLVNVNEVTGE